ncbi:unnamed protein product, partial [Strongylus vulgaris]
MIRGIDEDESDFLARVDAMKSEALRKAKKLIRKSVTARLQICQDSNVFGCVMFCLFCIKLGNMIDKEGIITA